MKLFIRYLFVCASLSVAVQLSIALAWGGGETRAES